MEQNPLNVQCFIKGECKPVFSGANNPTLLYISEQRESASNYPRIMHAHDDHVEIVLILNGESEYLIGNRKHKIRKGDLLIYNAGVVHDEISGSGKEVATYCLAVAGICMEGLRKNALIPDDSPYIYKTGDQFEKMRMICEIMFQSLTEEEGANKSAVENFCQQMMRAFLVMALGIIQKEIPVGDQVSSAEESVYAERMQNVRAEKTYQLGKRVQEYIDSHYREALTLTDISAALHVSTYYMSHVFKEMSGYSPMQYLLRRRIGEAQTLLASTKLPISEVAARVGYESQSYFNQQFVKNVGMAPTKYRKQYVVQEKEQGQQKNKRKKINPGKTNGEI